MSCACGHHHATRTDDAGTPARLSVPMVALHGSLTCTDMGQMMTALSLLPDHIELSRAEPGCLRFEITQAEDPMVWTLSEVFADADAFAAHQARTADSTWGRDSRDMVRDFHRHDLQPLIRAEIPADIAPLSALLGPDRADRMAGLRRDGTIELSLVAHAQGVPVGHVALRHVAGRALALTPLTVHPALRDRGLEQALLHMALQAAHDRPVVAQGGGALLSGAGFRAAGDLHVFGDLPADALAAIDAF